MTPESIRKIQEGKVFDYNQVKPEIDPVTALLTEQHITRQAQQATKKVKAGKTVIEVPVDTPQTNLPALQDRPLVDYPQLLDWLVAHPGATHAEISTAHGRASGWFSTVLVTSEFQDALEPRRGEIRNPAVTATMEERLQALMVQSVTILQQKMSVAAPGDALVLEAAKIGVRALGLGNANREGPATASPHTLESLADRLTSLVTSRAKGSAIGSVPQATQVVEDVTPKEA